MTLPTTFWDDDEPVPVEGFPEVILHGMRVQIHDSNNIQGISKNSSDIHLLVLQTSKKLHFHTTEYHYRLFGRFLESDFWYQQYDGTFTFCPGRGKLDGRILEGERTQWTGRLNYVSIVGYEMDIQDEAFKYMSEHPENADYAEAWQYLKNFVGE